MFPSEFCEISKNTLFYRTPPVAASRRIMYVAQMKPNLLISIGRWRKLMSDFWVVRQVIRQTNKTV